MQVQYYITDKRRNPAKEWQDGLSDPKTRKIIDTRIGRLRLGNFGECRPVGDGVNELVIDFGPGYRLYFGRSGKDVIILLCGGQKRGQQKDIDKAKEYWADYKARKDK